MNRLRYVLNARADVVSTPKEYLIDWDKIKEQVKEAALLVNKEPEMKKKGRKKKGY